MLKKISVFCIILITLISFTANAFTYYIDIEDNWAKEDILFATNTLEVFNGYIDGTFRPEENISRSEFCTILARACVKLGMVKESYTSNMDYDDLTIKNWSYTYIITLYEYINYFEPDAFEKIFTGDKFYPEKPITRKEVAQIVSKFCKYSIYDNDIAFNDLSKGDDLYDEIKVLYNAGILQGFTDNTMKLDRLLSRAESAAIIKRIYNYVELATVDKLNDLIYMQVENSDINSFFGDYHDKSNTEKDKRYVKAKNTLEYLEFGGYIFPDDVHLYDDKPIATLEELRNGSYSNLLGVDFYLIKYGEFESDYVLELAQEILIEAIKRDDLEDFEYEQIFSLLRNKKVDEGNYISLLKSWYDKTASPICKFNINSYLFDYYSLIKNKDILSHLTYHKLNYNYEIDGLMSIDFATLNEINHKFDFTRYDNSKYVFEVYDIVDLDMGNINQKLVVLNSKYLLKNEKFIFNTPMTNDVDENNLNTSGLVLTQMLSEKNSLISTIYIDMDILEQEIYYNYVINKAKIMYDLQYYEREFIDLINEYEVMKTLDFYKNNKDKIDIKFESILLELKYKSN